MHIVCPHCTTSYAINPDALGEAGRTVRCSRCKETWLARPQDAVARVPALAAAGDAAAPDVAAEWEAMAREEHVEPPVIDSPSISPDSTDDSGSAADWPSIAQDDADAHVATQAVLPPTRNRRRMPRLPRIRLLPALGTLPTTCAAMAALVVALVVWRNDVVRLLPQTALFYKTVGLNVNLRGLAFKDLKITNETVDGKPVLVIEGMIVGQTQKPVELPRLRFAVRDAQGAEIYAWNAVLEQAVLKPGETAFFKSRLASPPPEGRDIDVRFFNKRDVSAGHA